MTSFDPSQSKTIFASGDVAKQWQRGKAHRAEVNAEANEIMPILPISVPVIGFLKWLQARGIRRLWRRDASDQRGMY